MAANFIPNPTCPAAASASAPCTMASSGPMDPLQRQVTRLRNADPAKFKTLCHMHLSFLLDLDGANLEDILSDDPAKVKKHHNFPHFGRKKSKGDRNEMLSPQLDFTCVENIEVLIRFLTRPEHLALEGLFRKLGQLSRQRVLREKLLSGDSLESELLSGVYTAHDCANLLKTFLSELAEPLLTEKHFSIYCKLPDIVTDSTSERDRGLLLQRQMATAQLLVQLLPRENAVLLRALINLLHQVAETPGNLMTSETLGTMFAPHLLFPRRMSASELQPLTCNTTRAVAFLIENGLEIFKVPAALMRDISAYWKEMEEVGDSRQPTDDDLDAPTCQHRYRKHMEADALRTTVTFVDRQALQRAGPQTDTQVELANLYAHISTMPESAKKRKLLKQFNRANGVGTPITSKHKRSKSLSESIKKMVGRSGNHKRRGSGHSAQVHAVSTTVRSEQLDEHKPVVMEHTPIIRAGCPSSTSGESSPAPSVPIVRLFKDHPILPSSPCVHIVDCKAQPPLIRTRKRHFESPPAPSPLRTRRPLSAIARATPSNLTDSPRNMPTPTRPMSVATFTMPTPTRQRAENHENVAPMNRWTARSSKSPHAPVIVTPDRRFEKASSCVASCVSPITRSMTKAPTQVKAMLMTPGSRHPVSVLQSP